MKKLLSVVLSVILIAVSVPMIASAEDDELKFAVASDLHYNLPREQLEGSIDDDVYWYANRRAAMEDESGFIIDKFLEQCEKSDCQYVLISGDMADNGRVIAEEHYAVAEKLADFEKRTGKQVYVIDGNHDFGENQTVDLEKFKEIYKDFGYSEALEKDDTCCSYTANLGEKYRLIALDSCDPGKSTEDGMTTAKIDWVLKQAAKAKDDGRYPILMMHHNLLDHMPLQRIISRNFIIRNHTLTADKFASAGIKIVLTGHEHCSDATSYISTSGNKIYDFATTSLTMYPLQYRMFTLTDESIKYTAETVDSIDTSALTSKVNGYSDKQISLMNEGLNDYSKGFLKAGVKYRLSLSLSMEKIGIDESSPFYDIVKTAVDGVTNLLDMPLYGEKSVSELAESYGITLPESSYKNGWDVATQLVAMHYAGEENADLDSTEVKLLLGIESILLKTELEGISDELLIKCANAVIIASGAGDYSDEIIKYEQPVFGAVSAGNYFLLAIASPFLYEFGFDGDGVNDNTGTIESYASMTTKVKAMNLWEKITEFFKKLFDNFRLIFNRMINT